MNYRHAVLLAQLLKSSLRVLVIIHNVSTDDDLLSKGPVSREVLGLLEEMNGHLDILRQV